MFDPAAAGTAWLIWAAIGYLIGSIPAGVIIARVMGLGNLREIGSGNIGATNVLRTGSKKAAALTLLLDAGKGLAAVLLAQAFAGPFAAQAAGFTGHDWPLFSGLAVVSGRQGRGDIFWRALRAGLARGDRVRFGVDRLCCAVAVFVFGGAFGELCRASGGLFCRIPTACVLVYRVGGVDFGAPQRQRVPAFVGHGKQDRFKGITI